MRVRPWPVRAIRQELHSVRTPVPAPVRVGFM